MVIISHAVILIYVNPVILHVWYAMLTASRV